MFTKKITIFIIIISVALGISYALFFARPGSPPQERIVGETIWTEEIQCSDETYVFETVLNEDETGYFNNIYRNTNSPENFIVRLKAPTVGLDTFFVLAVPKEDCDKIYLTVARYETSRPRKGIFEWKIGEKEVHELAVSKEFFGYLAPSYPTDLKEAVSLDGEKFIVVKLDERITTDKWVCDPRILKLLHLREDVSEILAQLPEEEVFTNSSDSDFEGFCIGIDFGWVDDSTVYYDVYDATIERNRPLIERRTLSTEN